MQNKRQGKWQPFDALSGFQESLRNVEREKDKIPRPLLSEDDFQRLNNKIHHLSNQEIIIKYYDDGFLETISGKIQKVDPINKEIIINDFKIKINDIIDINEKA